MRIEEDCIGKLEIQDNVLYGINTVRAIENFPISTEKIHPLIVKGLIQIKKAAAQTNVAAGTLSKEKGHAIITACNELLLGDHADQFIVPAIQGGAGTSANMNVNEVIANLAMHHNPEIKIHPNDDVNQSQSTNDTFPTAGKMAMIHLLPKLLRQVNEMATTLSAKATAFAEVVKVGRTQMQDAVPTTLGNSFHAFHTVINRDIDRITYAAQALHTINLGGTAIGTGLNATDFYREHVVDYLNELTNDHLVQAEDLIDATQNCDSFVEFSNSLKSLAVDLIKIANDLRLLSSGPQAGLNEMILPAKQAGSSIMPGKINPVIPEVVNQAAFEVIGHDATVTMAAQAGQLELNAFEPIMFRDILQSEHFLTNAIQTLNQNCLADIVACADNCQQMVENSAITATVLAPILGYVTTTKIVKEAMKTGQSVKQLLIDQQLLPTEQVEQLFSNDRLLNRTTPTAHAIGASK